MTSPSCTKKIAKIGDYKISITTICFQPAGHSMATVAIHSMDNGEKVSSLGFFSWDTCLSSISHKGEAMVDNHGDIEPILKASLPNELATDEVISLILDMAASTSWEITSIQ